jgi:RNA polymerase sigma factor (sigma-70 family)
MVRSVISARDPHLIETAIGDTLLAVCRYSHTFRGDSRASTWLYTVVRRASYRCLRRENGNHRCSLSIHEEKVAAEVDRRLAVLTEPAASDRAMAVLEAAVPNPRWRELWLCFHDPDQRLSHEDLAARMGYTPASVAVILSRVRRRLAAAAQG